jgi:glycosyltransferase involved in cell wall biosynthesis
MPREEQAASINTAMTRIRSTSRCSNEQWPVVALVEHTNNWGGSLFCSVTLTRLLADAYDVTIYRFRVPAFAGEQGALAGVPERQLGLGLFEDSRAGRFFRKRDSVLARVALACGERIWTVLAILFLMRAFRNDRVDLVHANNSVRMNRAEILAASILRIPVICHVRGVYRLRRLDRPVARLVDRLVPVSKAVYAACLDSGVDSSKLSLVHDAVDTDRFSASGAERGAEVRRELGFAESDVVVLVPGRLQPAKGQQELLEAFALAQKRNAAMKALFLGDGPSLDLLQVLASELTLAGSVLFLPFQQQVEDFYRACDVVAYPSAEPEAFGLVVAEAMACAKPVVSTCLGGPRDIVEDGVTGFLVDPADTAAFAEKLARLAADAELRSRMGAAGRARAIERFSLPVLAHGMKQVYGEVLSGIRRPPAPSP